MSYQKFAYFVLAIGFILLMGAAYLLVPKNVDEQPAAAGSVRIEYLDRPVAPLSTSTLPENIHAR